MPDRIRRADMSSNDDEILAYVQSLTFVQTSEGWQIRLGDRVKAYGFTEPLSELALSTWQGFVIEHARRNAG